MKASRSVLPRPFFLLSLVTCFPFSFVKEKEKESNKYIKQKEFLKYKFKNIR